MKNNNFSLLGMILFISALTACTPNGEQFKKGQKAYKTHCESCHMQDGSGLGANIPPLAASDYLKEQQEKIACIITNGLTDTIEVNGITFTESMPGVSPLSEIQIANIINYINQAWGNDFGFVNVATVEKNLEACE